MHKFLSLYYRGLSYPLGIVSHICYLESYYAPSVLRARSNPLKRDFTAHESSVLTAVVLGLLSHSIMQCLRIILFLLVQPCLRLVFVSKRMSVSEM